MLLVAGCSLLRPQFPTEPYDHAPLNETSVAVSVPEAGEVGILASGLVRAGFFCAEVRANSEARQVWCRSSVDLGADAPEPAVTVVNVVATTDGTVQYAEVLLPEDPEAQSADPGQLKLLRRVLDASFLSLWPDDAEAVTSVLATVARGPGGFDPDDPHPPVRAETTTSHARYDAAEGRGDTVGRTPTPTFRLVTDDARDRTWPFGAEDYATTTTAAAAGLEAGGFDCYGPEQSPCTRVAGNQQISYGVRPGTDQILTAAFFVPGTSTGAAPTDLSGAGFPQGLTFLTPGPRAAVEARILEVQESGELFVGIVAGVVVIIDPPHQRPAGIAAYPVEVSVGVPLVELPG